MTLEVGSRVRKVGGRYGGPGRIVGSTIDLDPNGDRYRLYSVAMKVEGGYGEFIHVFPEKVLEIDDGFSYIPQHRIEALWRWINHGVEPGAFLTAIITNDLEGATVFASDQEKGLLHEYIGWLHKNAPKACWGSVAKCDDWASLKKAERKI